MVKSHHRRSSTASSIVSTILRTTFKRSSVTTSESSLNSPTSPTFSTSYIPRTWPIQYPSPPLDVQEPSSASRRPASLMDLPAEIRLQIYSYIFTPVPPLPAAIVHQQSSESKQQQIIISDSAYTRTRLVTIQNGSDLTPGVNMLQVCRRTYHECLPFVRRSVLIVPRLIEYSSSVNTHTSTSTSISSALDYFSRQQHQQQQQQQRKTYATSAVAAANCCVRALPLDRTRLGKLDALELQRRCISELVVHEYAESLPSTLEATTWERMGSVVRVPLAVDTVYLQLCACGRDEQQQQQQRHQYQHAMPGTSDYSRLRAGQIAGGVFAIFLSVQKVRRVVVYYCSVMRHSGSSKAVAQVQAMQRVLDEIVMERRPDGSDIWWTRRLDALGKAGMPDGVTRYIMTFPEFEGRPPGEVQVEFYDSYSQTGSACVLA